MPRRARRFIPGGCYHVINRGNNRSTVFHRPADYAAFMTLIRQAIERIPLEIFAACLMPNHYHLVVRPRCRTDIGRWLHWLQTTHSHRYHLQHGTSGRVWQGPYKAFPIEQDEHLLTVLRYVERNAVRAGLVRRARDWRWGSAAWRLGPANRARVLAEPPVKLPGDWETWVDRPQTPIELEALRSAVNRQRPFGNPEWQANAPECEGYDKGDRPRGRPRRCRPPGAADPSPPAARRSPARICAPSKNR